MLENKTKQQEPEIIAVSKTFSMDKILPLIDHGHINFGENKVQEADEKWKEIKKNNSNLKLHMIGKLQSNKVKKALSIFDYIHSVDNFKLAEKISNCEKELNKKIKYFIQVNFDNEVQKNGIDPKDLSHFIEKCKNDLSLNIIGLMCLPPLNEKPEKYFENLNQLRAANNLTHTSMGMTSDFIVATKHGSTFLRIGSKIFGKR